MFYRYVLFGICLFSFCAQSAAIDWDSIDTDIERKSLYLSPQWQALLHISEGRRWIDNADFLLSHGNFSYERELRLTIEYLYSEDAAVCRFPARYQWLRDQLPSLPERSLEQCDELQTFLRNAPADEVALVFASENLKSPSSMMGHIFLNIGGQRESGEHVEYSVSFFTDVDTWNVPRVFYESIVTGRPGYFALSPYQDQVLRYLHQEQRNVWRYQMDMSASERRIVQYHLFELRDTELTYYFHAYNCATLVNFVIAHSAPELLSATRPWVTPLGVIRESENLVGDVSIRPSSQWLIRAYSEMLPGALVRSIRDELTNEGASDSAKWLAGLEGTNQGFLALETARAFNDYRFETQTQEQSGWEDNEQHLSYLESKYFSDFSLDLSDYKDPLKSPKERQFQLGYSYQRSNDYLQLSLLPASHRLDDDNRQYFGESGLQIGELSMLLEPASGKVRVEHFQLYGMQSFIPRHPMMSNLSMEIGLGYEQHYDEDLNRHGAWYLEGAVGQTWRLHRAIDVYLLAGGGAAFASGDSYVYLKPTLGAFMRQSSKGKLHAQLSAYLNQLDDSFYTELSLTQSIFRDAASTLVIGARTRYSHLTYARDHQFSVAYKWYF